MRQKPLGTFGLLVTLVMITMAVFAEWLAPFPHNDVSLIDRMQGPSWAHPMGTDHVGRDLLSRVIYGARVSLIVGLSATAINIAVAVLVGGASGYIGGKLSAGSSTSQFSGSWMPT